MNFASSKAYLLVATLAFAVPAMSGCKVSGSAETAVRYEGTAVSDTVDYASGQNITIHTANGNIDVQQGGAGEVKATFRPFILDAKDNADNATAHMENNLELTLSGGGTITVDAKRKSGSSNSLGADLVVTIPSDFDGNITIDNGNGFTDADLGSAAPADVSVNQGNGGLDLVLDTGTNLDIFSDNGSVDLVMYTFIPGRITLDGAGDLYLGLPSDSDGTMSVVTGDIGEIIESIPADWTVEESSPVDKSYTMGEGLGGNLDVSAGFDVQIDGS